MPFHRPIGSDRSISPAVGTRIRRFRDATQRARRYGECSANCPAARAKSVAAARAQSTRSGDQPARKRRRQQASARETSPFCQAACVDCRVPMEWAWQHPPSVVIDPGEKERSAGNLLTQAALRAGLGSVASRSPCLRPASSPRWPWSSRAGRRPRARCRPRQRSRQRMCRARTGRGRPKRRSQPRRVRRRRDRSGFRRGQFGACRRNCAAWAGSGERRRSGGGGRQAADAQRSRACGRGRGAGRAPAA